MPSLGNFTNHQFHDSAGRIWRCRRSGKLGGIATRHLRRTHENVLLHNYEASCNRNDTDDEAYANKMVFIFARILSLTSDDKKELHIEQWDALKRETDRWMSEKPTSFDAQFLVANESTEAQAFPEMWLLKPAHVTGMQYYHM